MSSQNPRHPSIPFSISTPFRPVRLLEVPDGLLEIIVANGSATKLKFKSAPPSSSTDQTSGGPSSMKEGILHVCAGDKAWAVKQVSTSNSVYLIQPEAKAVDVGGVGAADGGTNDDGSGKVDGDKDSEMHDADRDALRESSHNVIGMTAIAQAPHFLELHPVKIDEADIERAISSLVPLYHSVSADEDIDLDLQSANESKDSVPTTRLLNDVPAPDDTVKRVCAKLGVFESTNVLTSDGEMRKGCMLPTTKALLETWSKLVEGCAIEGVRLDQHISVVRLANVLDAEDDTAIVEQMFDTNGMFDALGLFESTSKEEIDAQRKLNPEKTCRFIAGLILSSQSQKEMGVEDFMTRWTNLVPSSFVKHCTVENITAAQASTFELVTSDEGSETIKWGGKTLLNGMVFASALDPSIVVAGQDAGGGEKSKSGSAPTTAAADKKRKWHEKFGAQRNKK